MISANDRLIQGTEPFKLLKSENKAELDKGIDILGRLYGDLWRIAVLLEPIMPATALKLQECIQANKMPDKPLFMRK
jgi:methionyl-tRNA synthetase